MTIALEAGVKLRVLDDSGVPTLLTYLGRARDGGYKVKGNGEDPDVWSKDKMTRLRLDDKLEIYPGDPEVDDAWISKVLSRTFASFPPEYQAVAHRKAAYCAALKQRIDAGETADGCAAEVARSVFAEKEAIWLREDTELAALREVEASKRRKIPPSELKRPRKPRKPEEPSPQTICGWFRLWRRYREDIRVLLPAWDKRGQAGPRYALPMYEWMRKALEDSFLKRGSGSDVRYAYARFENYCKSQGLDAEKAKAEGLPRPYPSYVTFNTYKNKIVAGREEMRIREGSRPAYLSYNVFRKQERPGEVLAEVEIDHCLIDLMVVHPQSGRVLGRPWLTALLDRASSMVIGLHLSLSDPGYPAVQRCLAHAFWPKDLRGYPDLENPWPCEGIPREIFTDNGKEFHCESLKRAEDALTFRLRPLPVMSPWLKGKVERFFGRFNIQVLGHKEGKTFSSAARRGDYKPAKAAEWDMPRLRGDVLRYLVDDYHVTNHRGLRDAKPLEVWQDLIERQGGVRPMSSYDQVVELMGQHMMRPLSNTGININGINYWAPEFTQLKEDLGRSKEWVECRFDPYDLRRISVLNRIRGFHIRAGSTNEAISHGVSFRNSRLHLKNARALGDGKNVTEDNIRLAREQAERDADRTLGSARQGTTSAKAEAIYREPNGLFFTPVGGHSGVDDDLITLPAAALQDVPDMEGTAPGTETLPGPRQDVSPVRSAAELHADLMGDVDALSAAWED